MAGLWLLATTPTSAASLTQARGIGLKMSLPDRPPASELVQRLSPVTIAYLGDAVWEREVRERLLWPPSKLDKLSTRVENACRAEGQHKALECLNSFGLTDDELDWLRRGRNASARGPRRLEPKIYRASTALETLVGVLYLTDSERLAELFEFLFASGGMDVVIAGESVESIEPPPAAG